MPIRFAILLTAGLTAFACGDERRDYDNRLRPINQPLPILGDHPELVAPIVERRRLEANPIVADPRGRLAVRAWRYSYNARAIIEAPNRLDESATAVIMVHPWGVDDGQGWRTPQPAGAADFCTIEKNHLAARHTRQVINPLLQRLRPHIKHVFYSLPGQKDSLRARRYRSLTANPSREERRLAQIELEKKLKAFAYRGNPIPNQLKLSRDRPVVDYFRSFPGLDAGDRYNQAGFWSLPIPVSRDVEHKPNDIVIYDAEGYEPLKKFLQSSGVRHVLLTGYATDMCFRATTAGYQNLSKDFNVFLVGDATLATFPANASPAHATNAAISFASLNHLITQCSWIQFDAPSNEAAD